MTLGCSGKEPETTVGGKDPEPSASLEKLSYEPNPNGVGFGFWANYDYGYAVYDNFGRRPYERVGFFKWKQIESSEGVYDTDKIINRVKESHRLGCHCLIAINSIAGPWFNSAVDSQIPTFYEQDITDTQTRAALREFVEQTLRAVLPEVGELWISFDYELTWHCMPDTPEKQELYRAWYVEAVAIAREVAEELNMSHLLKIVPIVTSGLTDENMLKWFNSPLENHTPAEWMEEVVEVSDYFGIDCYDFDRSDPTSTDRTMEYIKGWVDLYSQGKPVLIPELGFSTSESDGYHASGTESEQSEFYKNLITSLKAECGAGGSLEGRVKGIMFWMYTDKGMDEGSSYGITREDMSWKPAFYTLRNGFKEIEARDDMSPSTVTATCDFIQGVELTYTSGTQYETIKECFIPSESNRLTIRTRKEGYVLLHYDDKWEVSEEGVEHIFTIENPTVDSYGLATYELFFTSGYLPFTQIVDELILSHNL